ncbi:hypothetical protein NFI96_002132 [Prochilodus magdalenae]|nr:hypothetical protein NFI96_002132 [Prochilodus magdalenae]
MMFLCSLSLFIIMIESCVSQSISSVDEKRNAVEGETVTLSCSYTGRAYYLYWYRQYPGSRPEFLLRIDPDNNDVLKADPPFPRLDVKLTGTKLDLVISSAKVSDSVLYYCALRPTVTRSPSTLYKNSLTDKALRCVWGFLSESCVSQSISPLEEKVDAVEGETVTLSCSYSGSAYYLFWYRQYPGSRPEFLLRIDPDNNDVLKADPPFPRLEVKLDESCVSQSISPLEEKVDAVEGQTVTLSCSYEYSGANPPSLHWYSQYPGSRPEFLLLTPESGAYVTKAENLDARMSIKVHKEEKKKVDLEISSAAVSDSVLYYCALAPTVTGNPDTLYEGNVNNLHWYHQYPGSRPDFLLLKYPTSPDVTPADPPFPRLDAAVNGSVVDLKISSAAVLDSVLYYCALQPTVTGNPDTLYRNWFYD